MRGLSFFTGLVILAAACAPQRVPVVFDLRRASEHEATSNETKAATDLEYAPVSTASQYSAAMQRLHLQCATLQHQQLKKTRRFEPKESG